MSSDGYDRLLELVAENPALDAEELVEMAAGKGIEAEDVRPWLEDALQANDLVKFGNKYWIVRKGRFPWGKYDHSVN